MLKREEIVESEEEEEGEEEEEEEEEKERPMDESVRKAIEANEGSNAEKRRRSSVLKGDDEPKKLTEAEMAMMAAKKRHEEEEAAKIQEYETYRRQERERIVQELIELKQKQIERKKQREEEYREMTERRMEEEKRRREEELERKARLEAKHRQKEAEKRKKITMTAELNDGDVEKNYQIMTTPRETEISNKVKNAELIAAEKEQAKKTYLTNISNTRLVTGDMLPNDLKSKIKQLHAKICKLEADKFDLEKRNEGQEYDLKELRERQLQVARHKALKRGLNPDEAGNLLHPPKICVASKFDRQIDRRSYSDRRNIYEHPFIPKPLKVARGTARPPPEWGCRNIEELVAIRKMTDRPQYVEVVKAEGDAAKPPISPIPLSLPDDSDAEKDTTKSQSAPETVKPEPAKPENKNVKPIPAKSPAHTAISPSAKTVAPKA